jgi:hypothetical protein
MMKKDFATETEIKNGIVVDGLVFSYVGIDECEILDDDNNVISVKVFCFSNELNEVSELVYND